MIPNTRLAPGDVRSAPRDSEDPTNSTTESYRLTHHYHPHFASCSTSQRAIAAAASRLDNNPRSSLHANTTPFRAPVTIAPVPVLRLRLLAPRPSRCFQSHHHHRALYLLSASARIPHTNSVAGPGQTICSFFCTVYHPFRLIPHAARPGILCDCLRHSPSFVFMFVRPAAGGFEFATCMYCHCCSIPVCYVSLTHARPLATTISPIFAHVYAATSFLSNCTSFRYSSFNVWL